jgi:fatty acid kinase fatty acid binding subunit
MKQRVALITDSSGRLPAPEFGRFDITVLPIQVQIGSEEFRDGVDLERSKLYRAIESEIPVKSSAPSPLDYLDAIERAEDAPVVIITPATEFTTMYRNARLGAELAGRPVTVVDSRSATAGHGLVVLAAAEARQAGGGLDDIVAASEDAASRTELLASLESLTFLQQSGRVPSLAVGLANQLGVRPVFRMRQGVVERLGLPRREDAALSRLVKAWRALGGPHAPRSAVFHAGRPERAQRLTEELGVMPAFATEFSAAMAIHTGPGVVGVAWLRPAAEPA